MGNNQSSIAKGIKQFFIRKRQAPLTYIESPQLMRYTIFLNGLGSPITFGVICLNRTASQFYLIGLSKIALHNTDVFE